MPIQGYVAAGKGEGAHWTALPWFRAALTQHFGLEPYPGTLNLTITEGLSELERALLNGGTVLVPPSPAVCCSLLLPLRLLALRPQAPAPVAAVLVRPLVAGYSPAQAELVGAEHLRRRLSLAEGDMLALEPAGAPGYHAWIRAEG